MFSRYRFLFHSSYYPNNFMNPDGGKSGATNFVFFLPIAFATHSAAPNPLLTAPSMVAGQPVAVQSPARNIFGQSVVKPGRYSSTPGTGENVAFTSLMTVAFVNFASRTAGKNSASSAIAKSIISWRDFSTSALEALTTNSR